MGDKNREKGVAIFFSYIGWNENQFLLASSSSFPFFVLALQLMDGLLIQDISKGGIKSFFSDAKNLLIVESKSKFESKKSPNFFPFFLFETLDF